MIGMTLLAGGRLWLLVGLGALALLYVLRQFRRPRFSVVLPTARALEAVAPRRPGWRRHATATLLLLSLGVTVFALARPAHQTRVPERLTTIMVALDVSRSMQATDVRPQRLVVAQDAAMHFVNALPKRIRVGVVTFAGEASIRVPPTQDRRAILHALRTPTIGDGTAIGEAVFKSLDAIQRSVVGIAVAPKTPTPGAPATPSTPTTTQVPAGTPDYRGLPPAGIVLLSDGGTTTGRSERLAAQAAKRAKVRVSTIAYGTPSGEVEVNGQRLTAPVQRQSLRILAEGTKGTFMEAATAAELRSAYRQFSVGLGTKVVDEEFTSSVLVAALALLMLTTLGALTWSSRIS